MKKRSLFDCFARWASHASGKPITFLIALLLVVIWATFGPVFKYSQTWQLVINTGTTIITFLMVFLIQSTQNRDTAALHIKLDELIRVTKHAHNALIDLEELNDQELSGIRDGYVKLAAEARDGLADDFPRFGTSPGKDADGTPIEKADTPT